jgi:Tfp pilus assembly protein PilF
VKKDSQSATFYYHLGMSYYKSGDQRKAKESLNRSVKLDPNLPQASEINVILGKI